MSGVVKAVKKVFKKVVSNPKTLVFGALAAGAIMFTAGAALGIAPMAAGWGGAAASMSSGMGLSGTLGSVVTGAITQAGYGAAIGGAGALLTGRDVGDGMMLGAATGAVTGGVTGAMAPPAGAALQPGATASPAQPGLSGGTGAPKLAGDAGADTLMGGADAAAAGASTGRGLGGGIPADNLAPAYQPPGFLERNQGLVGGLVSGLGQGLASRDAAEDAVKAQMERDEAEAKRVAGNYKVGEGGIPGYRSVSPGRAGGSEWTWSWDAERREIVKRPRA